MPSGDSLSQALSVPLKRGLWRGRLSAGLVGWRSRSRRGVRRCGCLVPGCPAGAGERVEGSLDAFGGEVAVQQVAELGAGQPVGGAGECGVDLFGERVAAGVAHRPGGGAGRVVPERERGGQVLGRIVVVRRRAARRAARAG